ncbi:Signal transduction histidine-protein kinase BaeS [Nymphon striatum]|nr:Signal transduction histidine-protein kinase BaeS [Nymphon striatum]
MQSPEAKLKPIRFNQEVIGYIQYKSFTKFTDELDKQFIQYQNHAFLKIALLALALILLGTGLLAAYLRSRINRIGEHAGLLTSGDFSPQTLDKSADELGQLSNKLNLLGKTLADNQLSRQRWVSDISHELRTPVAVLQGEIEAIQDGVRKLTPASIDSLHHEILRLSRLVNDLHDLSMSDMGALSYDKASTDIVELIEEGDWQRLEQLFSNLANNSRHYTSQAGSLHVDIRKEKNNVLIQWADSSPGVEDKDLSKLFDRLYRVDSSRNRNTGGSGLGLAICKNIVEAHDGEIVASHSDLGGVLFSISFPLLKNDYCVDYGYKTLMFHNGREAQEWLLNNQARLVLLDLMLPEVDGLTICKEYRKVSDGPVIMVTAKVEEIDRLLGLELGADDYICKPFSPREVIARIKTVLRRVESTKSLIVDDLVLNENTYYR